MTVEVVNIPKEELAEMVRDIVQEELARKLDPLLNVIVLKQKDVVAATIRNYLMLKDAGDLRPRKRK